MKKSIYTLIILSAAMFMYSCSGGGDQNANTNEETTTETQEEESDDPMDNKGIGPISSIELAEIDQALVSTGEELFKSKCSSCHKVDKRFVGPAIAGVVARRSPEWIMNMILNPEQMVEEDPIAMELLAEYLSPMANQSLTEEEARAILEYFRTL